MSKSTLRHLTDEAHKIVDEASNDLQRDARHAREHLSHAIAREGRLLAKASRAVTTQAARTIETGADLTAAYVRQKPLTALAIGVAAGLALASVWVGVRLARGRR
jgi:ElaB/YqjD/DUF883 family membrane-anchored ribosome-binding protein